MHPCVIAIDVGGTTIKAALADTDGRLVYRHRADTAAADGPSAVVANIMDAAQHLKAEAVQRGLDVVSAGVVVPGTVDESIGVAVEATNIGWRDVKLRDMLGAALHCPVAVGHDVRAGGLAEASRGSGRGYSDVLFVPIGTGIGAAMVIGGTPYPGAHYRAAEIGHIPVRAGERTCACGREQCLETVSSASAIASRYSRASGVPVSGAAAVADALRAGDRNAQQVWDRAVSGLAEALLIAATLFDPQTILLGGGLSEAGDLLMEPLRERWSKLSPPSRSPSLQLARLGDESGCTGAALMALDVVLA